MCLAHDGHNGKSRSKCEAHFTSQHISHPRYDTKQTKTSAKPQVQNAKGTQWKKKLIPVEIYRNREICLKEVSLPVSKTGDCVPLAQKDRSAVPSIGTKQTIIYIHTPVPVADGTLNSNISSTERTVNPLWLSEH